MKVAIIGAGVSGLTTARVLKSLGHDVVVFDRTPDVGGVWSSTRAYPRVSTQDDRTTYAFSDTPMPDDFDAHPTGEQVRDYLALYAAEHGITPHLRLGTEVQRVEPRHGAEGWRLTVVGPIGRMIELADWVVAANGVYSQPHVPAWPGRAEFEAAGGRVLTPTSLGDGADLEGRSVVVVGWGKTACDIAAFSSDHAERTTHVVRTVRWKMPKRVAGGPDWKRLILTRVGEHLLCAPPRTVAGRLFSRLDRVPRVGFELLLGRVVARQQGLDRIGMKPDLRIPWCDSLETDGYFAAVGDCRIGMRRDRSVRRLRVVDGAPAVELSDGAIVPADVVVPGTGFDQSVDFLAPAVRRELLDRHGDLPLYRRILPTGVDRIAFIGWGNTYRSPLTAEVSAVWLGAHLAGDLPDVSALERAGEAELFRLTHERAAQVGAAQLPNGSYADLDVLLADLRLSLPVATRLAQLVRPLDPADYADLLPRLRARLETAIPARDSVQHLELAFQTT